VLGVAMPPIAGIMVAEYFIVRRWRPALDEARAAGRLPETEPGWVPATLVIWVGAAVLGWWTEHIQFGIPALTSLAVAGVAYVVAGKVGLVRGTRELPVAEATA
jgi:cytosine permease